LDEDIGGKPIIVLENDRGEILDKQNRRVNSKGYLIDDNGNIVDRLMNIVFKSNLVSSNGEIPKVFRLGVISQKSDISIRTFTDRMYSGHTRRISGKRRVNNKPKSVNINIEIEQKNKIEEEKLLENSELYVKSRNSSLENSKMEDKPSNYNNVNLETHEGLMKNNGSQESLSSNDFEAEFPDFQKAPKGKDHLIYI